MAVAIVCMCEFFFYEVKGHTWAFPKPFTDRKSVKNPLRYRPANMRNLFVFEV